jgi:hypothetical protein
MFRTISVIHNTYDGVRHLYQAYIVDGSIHSEVIHRWMRNDRSEINEECIQLFSLPTYVRIKLKSKLQEENMKNFILTTNYPLQGDLFKHKMSLTNADGETKEYTVTGVQTSGLAAGGGSAFANYVGATGGGCYRTHLPNEYKYTLQEVIKKTEEELSAEDSVKKAEAALEAAKNTLKTIKEGK